MTILGTYLGWMLGFEESELYEEYKKVGGFTDLEYDETVRRLWNLEAFLDKILNGGA